MFTLWLYIASDKHWVCVLSCFYSFIRKAGVLYSFCGNICLDRMLYYLFLSTATASLAKKLSRPPGKRTVRSSDPACDGDLKIDTTRRYRVSAWTGRPGVSIL